jgi:hypothetical protein
MELPSTRYYPSPAAGFAARMVAPIVPPMPVTLRIKTSVANRETIISLFNMV